MGSTSKICMNSYCGTTSSHEWKRGWPLRSGGFADLCSPCGSAYETSVLCDKFHLEESGWRECKICGKRLHCGCIVSQFWFQLLDFGGVGCTNCAKSSQNHPGDELHNGYSPLTRNSTCANESTPTENRLAGGCNDEGKLAQLCRLMEANKPNLLSQSDDTKTKARLGQFPSEDVMHQIGELSNGFQSEDVSSSKYPNVDSIRSMLGMREMPSLSMNIRTPLGTTNLLPFSCGSVEERDQSKTPSPFQQGQRSRPILPKPSKYGLALSSESSKGTASEIRIARPPGEGRGKNQLLPRYWPRITDQELQQLSGDLNSKIVPLFEKVLSASDAGRIGRLVLPKACAEAYFPPISQSEGIPLRIQDVKGGEWTFQFRFWPNNNSRMYVLEGVTPCIQSMDLQAGDTITFSRIDPGGKLVIGYRKATNNSVDTQDAQSSAPSHAAASGETSFSAAREWNKSENSTGDDPMQQLMVAVEKKRTRNIGPKNKRLIIHSEDAMELRLTWEEAQDLLRPPPSAKPTIVTIEDHEFEEYDEPPVFGKKTIFTVQASGGQDQWAQCDDCMRWRKLPVDALLPPKWRCPDNIWDSSRSTCSSPEEISTKDVENLLRMNKDCKKRRIAENHQPSPECEPSGLDALASAAILGDNIIGDDLGGGQSVGTTTKHPRHRSGCTCIVCIQPPSGKGRHKPTCTCNVCMTVKRRFKTLMLRKKKRQSERGAEMNALSNNDNDSGVKDEFETNGSLNNYKSNATTSMNYIASLDIEGNQNSSTQIDLNCDPDREDMQMDISELRVDESRVKQNGTTSTTLVSCSLSQSNGDGLRRLSDEAFLASIGWDRETQRD